LTKVVSALYCTTNAYFTVLYETKGTGRQKKMALRTLRASSSNLTRQFRCPLSISSQRFHSSTGTHSDGGPPTSALFPRTRTTNTTSPTSPTITATATATATIVDPGTPASNKKNQNKNKNDNENNNNPLRLDLSSHVGAPPQPRRIHVACTPNNTHIVITDPQGNPLKASNWSGGKCGFKGVNRSGYEAGYQCAVRAFARIKQLAEEEGGAGAGGGSIGLVPRTRFEVLFKGFGQGRDAVFKALMTSEGDDVRPYVVRVTDKTPIKIGGTRARKTRRL
jgi:small subunit ribosomal protein S11